MAVFPRSSSKNDFLVLFHSGLPAGHLIPKQIYLIHFMTCGPIRNRISDKNVATTRPCLRINEILSKVLKMLKIKRPKSVKKTAQAKKMEQSNDIGFFISRSVILKDVIPFFLWFLLLILSVLSIDYFLHNFQLMWVGRFLGIPGILLLILSFVYLIKKRRIIKMGSIQSLLSVHILLTWIGTLLITVHAGIHFNAILPWSAYFCMLIVVISGLIGEYLLKEAKKTLRFKYSYLLDQGYLKEQVEKKAYLDALTVKTMMKWRSVHKPITWIFGILVILHIFTALMFWSWFK